MPATRRELGSVEDVGDLVRRFYQAVIPDPLLGPIFHDMEVDWGVHIPKLIDFWSLRLFGVSGYSGNAAGAHVPVFEACPFGDVEMQRWLELWEETVDELFFGEVADLAKQRARMAADAIGTVVRRRAAATALARGLDSGSTRGPKR